MNNQRVTGACQQCTRRGRFGCKKVVVCALGKIIFHSQPRIPDPWAVKLQILRASAADLQGLFHGCKAEDVVINSLLAASLKGSGLFWHPFPSLQCLSCRHEERRPGS